MENTENPTHSLPNGIPLSPDEARKYISAFHTHLSSLTPKPDPKTLGIAQKFDLPNYGISSMK